MENIDLLYFHDQLVYKNIRNYAYDSDKGMVWFTDKDGNKHEAKCYWHWWQS